MQEKITHAAIKLREGELAAFPTETVYGLGADATNDSAVAKIFAIKGRPEFNPLNYPCKIHRGSTTLRCILKKRTSNRYAFLARAANPHFK